VRQFLKTTLPGTLVVLVLAASAAAGGWFSGLSGGGKGSGELVVQTRDVKAFTRIETNGSADITVTVGPEQSVQMTFDHNLIDFIETEVRGKTLKIRPTQSFSSRHRCEIVITVPTLERVSCSGSGDIAVERLDAESFEFELSGSGNFTAEGKTDELEVSLLGSGDIDTSDLVAREAYVRISGSGDVQVHAAESLDARVSGSGDISYYGDPEHVSRSVTGSGHIRSR